MSNNEGGAWSKASKMEATRNQWRRKQLEKLLRRYLLVDNLWALLHTWQPCSLWLIIWYFSTLRIQKIICYTLLGSALFDLPKRSIKVNFFSNDRIEIFPKTNFRCHFEYFISCQLNWCQSYLSKETCTFFTFNRTFRYVKGQSLV